jgi:DNA-binding transcriptional MerR regulator
VSTATINFYVKEGLLTPPRKINRTRAAYSDFHLRTLIVIKRCQNAIGMSLAQIKRQLFLFGQTEEGLQKAEAIGALQPLPAVWGDARQNEIEHFEPLNKAAFLTSCKVDAGLLCHLEETGLLRPRQAGLYDANDAWLVRTIKALLDDGVELEWLAYNAALLPALREMARVVDHLAVRHRDHLRHRRMRFRDILEPMNGILGYLFDRVHDEDDPDWRDMLYD